MPKDMNVGMGFYAYTPSLGVKAIDNMRQNEEFKSLKSTIDSNIEYYSKKAFIDLICIVLLVKIYYHLIR